MSTRRLSETILDGGIRSVNFFNGRLLSGEDLSAEQEARRQSDERLGLALGDGVAFGLEVALPRPGRSEPAVLVAEGLAVNRRGHTLRLTQQTELVLARPASGAAAPSGFAFRDCQPPRQTVTLGEAGLYLLVISPAAAVEGRAPVSGLGNAPSACNTKYKVDAVQFRLLPLPPLPAGLAAAKIRNRVAYECFGIGDMLAFPLDPFNEAQSRTALLDRLRAPGGGLTDCDVPLAILHWTAAGIQFLDMWSVRRRLAPPAPTPALPPLFSPRRAAEGEAMILQFQEQIDDIFASGKNLQSAAAADLFDYLPPAGMIPVQAAGSPRGFRAQTFFGAMAPRAAATLDGAALRSLFRHAVDYDPIPVAEAAKLQLYVTFENLRAVAAGQSGQIALVFATRLLPFRGAARFNYAQFESGRFAPNSIR